jgi:hypothetical protein
MRKERLAKLSYQGEAWEFDGCTYIEATRIAREAFERALDRFVTLLSRA